MYRIVELWRRRARAKQPLSRRTGSLDGLPVPASARNLPDDRETERRRPGNTLPVRGGENQRVREGSGVESDPRVLHDRLVREEVEGQRRGLPNGGTLPGTSPVSSASSSRLAKREDLTPKRFLIAAESSLRAALSTKSRNSSPTFSSSALPPISSGSPRTRAASSEVKVGSCEIWRQATPSASRSARIDSRTAVSLMAARELSSGTRCRRASSRASRSPRRGPPGA